MAIKRLSTDTQVVPCLISQSQIRVTPDIGLSCRKLEEATYVKTRERPYLIYNNLWESRIFELESEEVQG